METNQDKYARAAERVANIRKFYGKITKFVIFIVFLIIFDLFIYELEGTWFIWILGFVSLGLILEASKLFGLNLILGKDWERRKIEEEMRKEENNTFYS